MGGEGGLVTEGPKSFRTEPRYQLLQLLHYQGELALKNLPGLSPKTHQAHERRLINRLVQESPVRLGAILHQLAEEGLVENGSAWTLTSRGYYQAYNLCEFQIQEDIGYWEVIFGQVTISQKASILDVGAAGGFTPYVGDPRAGEANIFALDYSVESLEAGRELAGLAGLARVCRICGDGNALPVGDSQMDVVICKGTLHYLDPESFLEEVRRVLKPGGILVLGVPSWKNFYQKWKMAAKRGEYRSVLRFGWALANTVVAKVIPGGLPVKGRRIRGETLTSLRRFLKRHRLEILYEGELKVNPAAANLIHIARKG